MNEIVESRVKEINKLHQEIGGYLKMTLDKAIRIGELLQEQKAGLKHGEWLPWVKENLSFTGRTARNYMMLHANKETVKTETISDLTKAYKLLTRDKFQNRRGPTLEELKALKRLHGNDFWAFMEDCVHKSPRRMDDVKVPEDWNYDASVKEMRGRLKELKTWHAEL